MPIQKPIPQSPLVQGLIPIETVVDKIYMIRRQKVMLDADLAHLYGVTTFNLNKAVKRNLERFPADFMFRLSKEEAGALKFQIGISKPSGRGGRRYLPYAFTEQGVAVLSSILRSSRAIQVNIAIMRAFVRLREILATHKELARKLAAMEKKFNAQFRVVFRILAELQKPEPLPPSRRIGFVVRGKSDS